MLDDAIGQSTAPKDPGSLLGAIIFERAKIALNKDYKIYRDEVEWFLNLAPEGVSKYRMRSIVLSPKILFCHNSMHEILASI